LGLVVSHLEGLKNRPIALLDGEAFDNLDKKLLLRKPHKFSLSENVYIWGDSYADALTYPIKDALLDRNIGIVGFIRHSCPSLLGTLRNEPIRRGVDDAKKCKAFNLASFSDISKVPKNSYVVITSAYDWYESGKNRKGEPILLADNKNNSDVVISSLKKTVEALLLLDLKPIVVLTHPTFNGGEIRKSIRFRNPLMVRRSILKTQKLNQRITESMQGLEVELVDPIPLLCGVSENYNCNAYDVAAKRWIVWRDGSHLYYYGGSKLANYIASIINGS